MAFTGPAAKTLYISTNAPANPLCRLEMRGTVIPVLDIRPSTATFRGQATTPQETVVSLCWKKGGEFKIIKAASNSPYIAIETKEVDAATWQATIRTVPPLPPGMTSATVTLSTNRPECPPITIPVLAGPVPPAKPAAKSPEVSK